MPEISIIVPVYNVEKYLEKCVDSILAQTFRDFEVVLVDDGATDSSGKLCDQLCEKDARIRVIHKENGGLSSARNAGIENARGNYLAFIDSDDYIDPGMMEELYRNIVNEDADLSVCGMFDCYYGKEPKIHEPFYQVMDPKEAIDIAFTGDFSAISSVNKLYKSSVMKDIRFPVGKIYEDAFICVDVFLACKKIVLTSKQYYYYYHRENSITTMSFSKKKFDTIAAYQHNYQLIKEHYPELIEIAAGRLFWAHMLVLDQLLNAENRKDFKEQEDQIVGFLKKHRKQVMKSPVLTRSRKIGMAALSVNRELYKQIVLYNMKKNLKSNL